MSDGQKKEPLSLDVQFKNLGKIDEANIRLRPFTVIAGCNGSGKSFITRTLYSLFDSSIERKIFLDFFTIFSRVFGGIDFFKDNFDVADNSLKELFEMQEYFDELFSKSKDSPNQKVEIIDFFEKIPATEVLELCDKICRKLDSLELIPKANPGIFQGTSSLESGNQLANKALLDISENKKEKIKESCNEVKKIIKNPKKFANSFLSKDFFKSLTENFMTGNINSIIKEGKDNAFIEIEKTKNIEISLKNIGYEYSAFLKLNKLKFGSSIYLESPVYWKLTDALKASRKALNDTAKNRRLDESQLVNQVPKYFFDLLELLEVQVKTNHFDDIIQTIEQAINGNLSFNDGNIQFSDNASNTTVGLNLTALGVTNLGMIALLLKRGAILPGTFLFIDEPEVHLHPSWQVIFIQVLHELSKRGVHVVIASHSIDIMKAIENIMDSDEGIDPQTHFGINQLTKDGNSVDDSENNFKRLAAIKKDLGTPFYEMFLDQRA